MRLLPHRAALGQLAGSYGRERLAVVVLGFQPFDLGPRGVVDERGQRARSLGGHGVPDRPPHPGGVLGVLVEGDLVAVLRGLLPRPRCLILTLRTRWCRLGMLLGRWCWRCDGALPGQARPARGRSAAARGGHDSPSMTVRWSV